MSRAGGGRVDREQLLAAPHLVAPHVLGASLISNLGPRVELRITEVEAYAGPGEDPGSHAHRGRTRRNEAMFGEVGHAYVYLSYGVHWCVNIVAHRPGGAGAVLLRAGEITSGEETARRRRPTARGATELARGPARLTACLGISRAQDSIDVLDPASPLRLVLAPQPDGSAAARMARPHAAVGPRTGVAGEGAETPWRFWLPQEPSVSPYRPARPRRRP